MKILRTSALWCAVLLMGAAGLERDPLLQALGSFLVVEDTLHPAAAIIPLGGEGKPPYREFEAAKLYRAGWAPLIVIVRRERQDDSRALRADAFEPKQPWELTRDVLIREGVPASAILMIKETAQNTFEELRAASSVLRSKDARVILVTSKHHTRRARLTWNHVAGSRSQAIVRSVPSDSFDPTRWWHENRVVANVVREYLGILNCYAGFPIRERVDPKTLESWQTKILEQFPATSR